MAVIAIIAKDGTTALYVLVAKLLRAVCKETPQSTFGCLSYQFILLKK